MDRMDYCTARIWLTEAQNEANLCYWMDEDGREYHDKALREALTRAALALGYTLAPITTDKADEEPK